MATPREIKDRIQAVTNTKKITKTMEMISAAKAKKAIDKVHAAQPYAQKINELIANVSSFSAEVNEPLLRKPESTKKIGILVLTANRGLCGGFNNNVIKLALQKIREYNNAGIETEVHLVGKKSVNVFNYQKVSFSKSYTHIDDRPKFEDISAFADYFMEQFESGKFDAVEIIYTKYFSASKQSAVSERVLPLAISSDNSQSSASAALFEPDPETIIKELVPRAIRVIFYQTLLESAAGEQIMRRIAMKNATDSATDMIKDMTRLYNRARQSKITAEISEIVAGADSVSK
jgi:F-type H+-transporting ATPase subunit gamma